MAAIPLGIEACLKPAVFENTRILGLPSLLLLEQLRVKKAQQSTTPQNEFFMLFVRSFQFSLNTFANLPNRTCAAVLYSSDWPGCIAFPDAATRPIAPPVTETNQFVYLIRKMQVLKIYIVNVNNQTNATLVFLYNAKVTKYE